MICHLIHVERAEVQIVVLLDAEVCDLDIFINIEGSVFQRFLSTCHGATIDGDKHLARLGGLDHSTHMTAYAGQTEIPAHATLRKLDGRLVGDLPDVGASGTRKNEDLIRFAKAFFFHVVLSHLVT